MDAPATRAAATAPRVLVIEDELSLRVTLSDRLTADGYAVQAVADGESGLARARDAFDLIILDVMLPGINGFDTCRELRRRGTMAPILMLTARGQLHDKVSGLRLGADDYLTKPFHMAELIARLEALLRRRPSRPERGGEVYRFGDVMVNFRSAEVTRGGRPVELSPRELKLLRHFVAHRGETLSRDELLTDVWGHAVSPLTRTVDAHVAGLRQKLEPEPHAPQHLVTVHGLGYKFVG